MLLLCVSGITAVAAHLRCTDAAREAARLAARGDDGSAAAQAIAPKGAELQIRRDGQFVVATVTMRSTGLPGVTIEGRAVAALEPGVG